MTIYYKTKDGKIINNHDVGRAFKKSGETQPFAEFKRAYLAKHGAKRHDVTTDELIKAGLYREAAYFFMEYAHCDMKHAKNVIRCMREDLDF